MNSAVYQITFERAGESDIVLLTYGDRQERAVELASSGLVQAADFAGAAAGGVFGRGNQRVAVNFDRLSEWATHLEVQETALSKTATFPLGVKGTLLIETQSGDAYRAGNFVFDSARFLPARSGGFRLVEEYGGQGSALAIVV
jgi:hypothetical protein